MSRPFDFRYFATLLPAYFFMCAYFWLAFWFIRWLAPWNSIWSLYAYCFLLVCTIRVKNRLDTLTTSLIAWKQFENGLNEFKEVLGKDTGALKRLTGALELGSDVVSNTLAHDVKEVAKRLSEKMDHHNTMASSAGQQVKCTYTIIINWTNHKTRSAEQILCFSRFNQWKKKKETIFAGSQRWRGKNKIWPTVCNICLRRFCSIQSVQCVYVPHCKNRYYFLTIFKVPLHFSRTHTFTYKENIKIASPVAMQFSSKALKQHKHIYDLRT